MVRDIPGADTRGTGQGAQRRRERSTELRIKNARFRNPAATLETFDWKFNGQYINRAQMEELATGDFIRRGDNLDLKAIARVQLMEAGVARIHDTEICTICGDPQLTFSYRREGPDTGRQAAIAWLS